MARHYRPASAKLTCEQADKARRRYSYGGISQAALGQELGVSQVAVSKLVRGLTYLPLANPRLECPRGHLFTPENTYANPRGVNECRTCRRAARRAYRDADRERVRAQLKASKRRRKARLRGVAATLTSEQWDMIQLDHAYRCHYCGAAGALDQEHLTPLSRGGAHSRENVAPACRSCNSQKATMNEQEFAHATWACLPGVGTVCLDGALLARISAAATRSIIAER